MERAGRRPQGPLPPLQMPPAHPLSPYGIVLEPASQAWTDNAIIPRTWGSTRCGQRQALVPFRSPRRWLTSGGLGTMGFGFPAAIGASLGRAGYTGGMLHWRRQLPDEPFRRWHRRGRNVNVKIVPDGPTRRSGWCISSRRAVLRAALRREHVPAGNGLRRHRARVRYAGGEPGCGAVDPGAQRSPKRWGSAKGPVLIHVPLDVHEKVYPMVPPGAATATWWTMRMRSTGFGERRPLPAPPCDGREWRTRCPRICPFAAFLQEESAVIEAARVFDHRPMSLPCGRSWRTHPTAVC